MDDFLLLCDDRAQARWWLASVAAFLAERSKLRLNPRRLVIAPLDTPCDFLGYVHFADGRRRVRRRSVGRLWRRLLALQRRLDEGKIDREAVRASVASWFGLAGHADAFRLSRSIFRQRDVENIGKRLLVKALHGKG